MEAGSENGPLRDSRLPKSEKAVSCTRREKWPGNNYKLALMRVRRPWREGKKKSSGLAALNAPDSLKGVLQLNYLLHGRARAHLYRYYIHSCLITTMSMSAVVSNCERWEGGTR